MVVLDNKREITFSMKKDRLGPLQHDAATLFLTVKIEIISRSGPDQDLFYCCQIAAER